MHTSICFWADEKAPDFITWLKTRTGYSPQYFYMLCLKTGYASDYYKAMDWYRMRYRYEMDLRRRLVESNPFEACSANAPEQTGCSSKIVLQHDSRHQAG